MCPTQAGEGPAVIHAVCAWMGLRASVPPQRWLFQEGARAAGFSGKSCLKTYMNSVLVSAQCKTTAVATSSRGGKQPYDSFPERKKVESQRPNGP